jgi:hypothetical protein
MSHEEIPSGPLTDEEREDIARVMWRWFRAFGDAGFPDDQALKLCAAMLRGTL